MNVIIKKIEPTTKSHLVSLLGALLIGAYLLGFHSTRLLIAGAVILVLPHIVMLLLHVTVGSAGAGLYITRTVLGRPVEGYYSPVRIRVESRGIPLPLLIWVRDSPPRDVRVDDEPRGDGILLPGGTLEITYKLVPRIGRRRFGKLEIGLTDVLGLAEARLEVDPDGYKYMTGYPSRAMIESTPTLKEIADPYANPSTRLIRGQGTEIYSIREFVEGDEPRLIDWKATARTGKLYVKELRREAEIPVVFVIAASEESSRGEPYMTPFELLLRAVYVLARIVADKGNSLGYISLTGNKPIEVQLVRGREAIPRISDAIALTMPPARGDPRGVEEVVRYVRKNLASKGVIIFVGDIKGLRSTARAARALERMKHRIYALYPGEKGPVLAEYAGVLREAASSG